MTFDLEAALKKLGAAKRARGKALVEERTRNLMLMAAQGKTNLLIKKNCHSGKGKRISWNSPPAA